MPSYPVNVRAGRFFKRAFGLVAVLLTATLLTAASIEPKKNFNIPTSTAEKSLKSFSQQSGRGVIFLSDAVASVRTQAVEGSFTPGEALERLVADTDLVVTHDEKTGAYAVRRGSERPNAPRAAAIGAARPLAENRSRGGRPTNKEEEIVHLTPFEVTSIKDTTYRATNASVGSRLGTALKDIPQSIDVVTQAFIEDISANSLHDVLGYVAGVSPSQGDPNVGDQTTIRGFATPFPFKDGVRDETLNATGDLADVERIEVLRGPSSFLYGNVFGFGGMINKVSKKPQAQFGASVRAIFGSFDRYRGELDLTGPLSSDKSLKYRVIYAHQEMGSYRDFVSNDKKFFAPKLTKIFSQDTQLHLDGEYLESYHTNDQGLPILLNETQPVNLPASAFLNEPDAGNAIRKTSFRAILDHKLTRDWSVRQTAFLSNNDGDKYNVQMLTQPRRTNGVVQRQITRQLLDKAYFMLLGDVVGQVQTGPFNHRILTGYEYSYQDGYNRQSLISLPPTFDIFNPVYGSPRGTPVQNLTLDAQTKTFGLYLSDHIKLFKDRLQFVIGSRYDMTWQTSVTNGLKDEVQPPSSVTNRFGVVGRPWNDLSVYAVYSEGFIPDTSGRRTYPDNDTIEPEVGEMYEVGVKTELFDSRLSISASAFEINRRNIVRGSSDPAAPAGSVVQIGEELVEGGEVVIHAQPLTTLSFLGSYTYTNGHVVVGEKRPNGTDRIRVGSPLQNASMHSAMVWVKYTIPKGLLKGLALRLDARYRSEFYGPVTALIGTPPGPITLPGYTLLGAGLSYSFKRHLDVNLTVENLADRYYFFSANAALAQKVGSPRAWLMSLKYKF